MSSGQLFTPLPGTVDPNQLCGDAPPPIVSTDWYSTNTYTYPPDSYVHPYTTAVQSQQWAPPYAQTRASAPELHLSTAYGTHMPHPEAQLPPGIHHVRDADRPRSSPSSFGPSAESIPWTTTGLGIHYTTTTGPPIPVTSTMHAPIFQDYATGEPFRETYPVTTTSPDIVQPQPRRSYPNILPNPVGVGPKRKRGDDDDQPETASTSTSTSKRRRRTASVVSADLNDEERFLVQLKEEENLPWKEIAARFLSDKGKPFHVATLQMRYKRLREKFRVWEDEDVQALKLAHEYWEKYKWEIISAKMLEFGISERWPARLVRGKWQDLEIAAVTQISIAGMTPTSISQFSSPTEGAAHFTFMPLQ